ncbi:MAG: hypothetical protein RJQ01_03060 [Microcella sp.]|uniref:DUF6993 domain-containing protein n=1 Tax=Microcella sp. TaxID=1913979 RepID=UPI0033148EAA
MLSRPSSRRGRASARAAGILVSAFVLAGCAVEREPVPSPSSDAPVDPFEQPRITPGIVPEFVEGGTAAENLDYFAFRLDALIAQVQSPTSRELVDSVVDAGFDKAAMEVTADTTPTGMAADSILVAVRLGDDCLLGQVVDGQVVAGVAPVLSTGRCLVGRTLSLD